MGLFNNRTDDDYEQVLLKAKTDPKNLDSNEEQMLRNMKRESGSRGNRARNL